MGDMQLRASDGAWDAAPAIAQLRAWVAFDGEVDVAVVSGADNVSRAADAPSAAALAIPLLPLAHERGAYLKLGRVEKAERIAHVLAAARVRGQVG